MDPFDRLHPAVQYHVVNSLGWTTLRATQLEAIEPIQAGLHCLLLAPTAGGKTEAAIIPVLSRMLTEEWRGTSVLYVCPIKALLNNLEERLSRYAAFFGRTVQVWHGDVSGSRKKRALADPPDILLTTPESIEAMLISPRIERTGWFGQLRTVIVDELHAFAGDDRGWHLRALLLRLSSYAGQPLQRLGLSATVRNPQSLLEWFAPEGDRQIVGSVGVSTDADVVIDHVGSIENAAIVISRLHRGQKRLVFCDSRSVAERLSNGLHELGVRTFVSHGSLSADERKRAEAAFATERDCVIVATSTLELGIDVGDLDQVIQIDSPSTVSSFLQRMGRTGRRSGTRRSCTFLTLDEKGLMMAMAIASLWRSGWVEDVQPPPAPWSVVAQQAIALTLEHGQIALPDLHRRLEAAFSELQAVGLRALIAHLLATEYLTEAGSNVLIVGPATEREYGHAHYRNLLATFSSNPLLTGRHGSSEIGLIDPSNLAAKGQAHVILLGGKSWAVREVDWRRGIAWLEPTKAIGHARWQGSARDISGEAAGALRRVLQSDDPPSELSRRARTAWEELRASTPLGEGSAPVTSRDGTWSQLWTYAGTRVNRTLARSLPQMARAPRFDALKVEWEGPQELLGTVRWNVEAASSEEVDALRESIKFNELIPADLLSRMLASRLWVEVPPPPADV
ncbi:MAG: DEAD/DEAH box helicase [Ramlibacter sp.]